MTSLGRRARRAMTSQETIPPQNEVSGGPDTPLELGRTGWRQTLQRTAKKFTRDRCSMTAGSLAYHWFLALFPAVIALLGVASLAHISSSAVHRLVNGLDSALPPGASGVFSQAVQLRHLPVGQRLADRAAHRRGDSAVERLGGWPRWRPGWTGLRGAGRPKFVAKRLRAFPLMLATAIIGGVGLGADRVRRLDRIGPRGSRRPHRRRVHCGVDDRAVAGDPGADHAAVLVLLLLRARTASPRAGSGSARAAWSARPSSCSHRSASRSTWPSSAPTARHTARSPE